MCLCVCVWFHREKTEEYTKLIRAKDSDGIMALLTDTAVEERVIARVSLKAANFGQDIRETGPSVTADQNGESSPGEMVDSTGTILGDGNGFDLHISI